jgi:drug/metabolite transporter (DMT)-like permease
MGIFYGLMAALCWGVGDFWITALTRRVGTPKTMFSIQILSLAFWIVFLMIQPNAPHVATVFWALAVAAGVFHVLGLVCTYKAFEIGTLALVSPIMSGFAVVTALLALMSGERPPIPALTGTALLIAGVVLATRAPAETQHKTLAGVPQALLSALAFGVMFWMFDFIQPKLGFIWPLLILKAMATSNGWLGLRAAQKQTAAIQDISTEDTFSVSPPATDSNSRDSDSRGTIWLLAFGAAAADTLAWVAFIYGTRTEYVTIVTALASLFSAVTVLLAWALLRDRLALNQWAGVAVILLGILLVSL